MGKKGFTTNFGGKWADDGSWVPVLPQSRTNRRLNNRKMASTDRRLRPTISFLLSPEAVLTGLGVLAAILFLSPTCLAEGYSGGFEREFVRVCAYAEWQFGHLQAVAVVIGVFVSIMAVRRR